MEIVKSISDMKSIEKVAKTLKAKTRFFFVTRREKFTYKELCANEDSVIYFGSCLPQINKILSMLFYDGFLNRENLSGEYRYFLNGEYTEKISSRKNKIQRLEEEIEFLKNKLAEYEKEIYQTRKIK